MKFLNSEIATYIAIVTSPISVVYFGITMWE